MSALALLARAFPFLMPAVVLALEWKLLSPTPALADHFQFWAAGHIVLGGASPYDREAWVAMAAYGLVPDGVAANTVIGNLELTRYLWLYPPHTAFVFAPFGALPLAVGIPLLHLVVVAGAVWGVAYSAWAVGLRGTRLAFALMLVALSQPFVIGVRDGHPLGFILGGLTLAYVGARDRRALPLAVGAVLVSIKPHIVLVFAVGLALVLLARREWRLVAWTTAALAAAIVPAEIVDPFPLSAFSAATDERLALDLSNLAALSRDLGAEGGLVLPLAALSVAAAVVALRLAPARARGVVAFAAALCLSLVLSSYAHDYDQLLNMPAAFVGLVLVRGTRYELAWIVMFALLIALMPWLLFFWWPLLSQGDRIYQAGAIGALPVISLLGLAAASAVGGRAPVPPDQIEGRADAAGILDGHVSRGR